MIPVARGPAYEVLRLCSEGVGIVVLGQTVLIGTGLYGIGGAVFLMSDHGTGTGVYT